ncbi:nitrogenase-stabilizing/protective protein NifW [Methylomonas rivi]|uniref:Nitrogenase-stabilizing/protective protein NifW n=1 Tax=Methylomonas rivi TaxID=2952226 RepID=A0ABT1U9I9_9GAMM|nr:nitrogenase-stabilizing/protective protein NifW [Methylomonas sp. WSC-6]MBS4050877.1 nitrogenase-stabilizing/protective protein NifW [Methylomonas sp.]MCQ8130173.1 nitrogenase-stabilizing/protective protein NifW [Methylomonas sp. WSC-6]
MSFEDDMEELESAEDFLQYFELAYDQTVVHVNRLHILQRFHDYLDKGEERLPEDEDSKRQVYKQLLARAYQDFVDSDAQTEKVFKVFNMPDPQNVFVALTDIKT